jgi:hypothetical protein
VAQYILTLRFSEEAKPFLLDVASLLYDIELSHDFGVLLVEPDYKSFEFSRFFWFRQGRPIKPQHRARAARIVKQSPLLLEVVIPSLGALWVLLQIIEKISNWPLSKEKLELEVEKLRRERDEARERIRQQYADQLHRLVHDRKADPIEHSLTKRLSESPIRLVDLEVRKAAASDDPDSTSNERQ